MLEICILRKIGNNCRMLLKYCVNLDFFRGVFWISSFYMGVMREVLGGKFE